MEEESNMRPEEEAKGSASPDLSQNKRQQLMFQIVPKKKTSGQHVVLSSKKKR